MNPPTEESKFEIAFKYLNDEKKLNNAPININKRTRKSEGPTWTNLAIRKGRDRIRCP